MPYAAKAKTQQFIRRKSNLVKKADQLARLCHALDHRVKLLEFGISALGAVE